MLTLLKTALLFVFMLLNIYCKTLIPTQFKGPQSVVYHQPTFPLHTPLSLILSASELKYKFC